MLEQAEADGRDDEAQLAFDALLYRLVVVGEAVKALPEDLRARQPQSRGARSHGFVTSWRITTTVSTRG